MGQYTLKVLLQRWQEERITVEQAIGQLMQLVLHQDGRIERLEDENVKLKSRVYDLEARR